MEAIGLLYAQFYSSCTPFRVRKVLELCPGLVEFIVVSIFFFFFFFLIPAIGYDPKELAPRL